MPLSQADSITFYGDEHPPNLRDLSANSSRQPHQPTGKDRFKSHATYSRGPHEPFILTTPYHSTDKPFFVPMTGTGVLGALEKLDETLLTAQRPGILSKKNPVTFLGRTIEPGFVGIYDHGGLPKLLTKPGRYPGFPFANWFARSWHGARALSETVVESNGLIIVQVSQNQAAVIADPRNQVFVVKNGGFVAISVEGTYRVLGVVDQVNLKHEVVDPLAGGQQTRVLGHTQDVLFKKSDQNQTNAQDYVAATFLDIPANNCVILQKGDDLELLGAGQHVITNPNITVRGWFSKGEAQLEMPSRDMYTRDQVPVELRVYLRWQLIDPMKLCYHGYETPYAALKDKAMSVMTQIVSHLEYGSMIKQRSFKPGDDARDGPDDASTAFLDALRTQAMDELYESALEYGIILRDLAVIDRKFKGEIAKTMDTLTTRALQAQVEAANVERENSNRVKKEEGSLQVSIVQGDQRRAVADATAYELTARAKAEADATRIRAEAQAEAVKIEARAEAEAIRIKAEADANVKDEYAKHIQMARLDVLRIGAYGNKTVFVPHDGAVGNNVAAGFGLAMGGKTAGKA